MGQKGRRSSHQIFSNMCGGRAGPLHKMGSLCPGSFSLPTTLPPHGCSRPFPAHSYGLQMVMDSMAQPKLLRLTLNII